MTDTLYFQQLFEKDSSTYTYLLADRESKEAILIDSVQETVGRDLQLIDELGFELKYVLDTHIHADHVTGAGEIRSRRPEVKTAVPKKANVACADVHLKEGDEVSFGSFKVHSIETPGHTDASLSYQLEDMVFTGDALLIRGTGRTDFQSGSSEELYDSITEKLFKLPPQTKVYPAHDYKGLSYSTIEMEMRHNPRVGGGKSKTEFVKIMSELKLANPKKISEALPANLACGVERGTEGEYIEAPTVTAEDLLSRLGGRTLVADVRNRDEFLGKLGHIPGAHLIPLGEELTHFLQGYERSEEIVFVCRSGQRSGQAAIEAINLGYANVANLKGGMEKWQELKLPSER